jgi:CheY-like chemotaxis protein
MPKRPLILTVDDESNGLEGRKMLLERHGYEVLAARSGVEGLQLFASSPVELVLLDYKMPPMNGDVVAERMKAGQPHIPIAILSAEEGLPASALRSAEAFISKSEPPANFLRIVQHLLDIHFLHAPLDRSEVGKLALRSATRGTQNGNSD